MDGGALFSIGDLARRTGLTVKVIRFYSDSGIVPPVGRSTAGHRRYDSDAVARLELVRTLRSLGLDLPAIRKVADREVSLPEVAAAHAEAPAVQIRLVTANDPRRDRYLQLLAVINGWPGQESLAPALDWFIRALRARFCPVVHHRTEPTAPDNLQRRAMVRACQVTGLLLAARRA